MSLDNDSIAVHFLLIRAVASILDLDAERGRPDWVSIAQSNRSARLTPRLL